MKEKEIEAVILDFLALQGGLAFKMNMGGKPLKKADGTVQMIPFMNKYTPKGMSDIMYIQHGRVFFLEVKTPREKLKTEKKYKEYLECPTDSFKSASDRRIANQVKFIEAVKAVGEAKAGLVSSVNEAEELLKNPSGIDA